MQRLVSGELVFRIAINESLDQLNTTLIQGTSFDQPEWNSYVTPIFYVGQKFIQAPSALRP